MFSIQVEKDTSFDFLDFSSDVLEESYEKAFDNSNIKEDVRVNKLVRDEVSTAFSKLYH